MSYLNQGSLSNNFPDAESYTEQLQALQSQTLAVLDDFVNDFVNYSLNTQNTEAQQSLQNDKNAINGISSQLKSMSSSLDTNINIIDSSLVELNELIQEAKQTNKELNAAINLINNTETSDQQMTEYKEMYNYGYLRNWGLAISIIIGFVAISSVYKNNNVTIPTIVKK